MTKIYEFGEMAVSVLKVGGKKLLVVATDGLESHEFEIEYPTEYLRNFAYDNTTEDMCSFLANGCSKMFTFLKQMQC